MEADNIHLERVPINFYQKTNAVREKAGISKIRKNCIQEYNGTARK